MDLHLVTIFKQNYYHITQFQRCNNNNHEEEEKNTNLKATLVLLHSLLPRPCDFNTLDQLGGLVDHACTPNNNQWSRVAFVTVQGF